MDFLAQGAPLLNKAGLIVCLAAGLLCGCVNSDSQRDRVIVGAGLGAATGMTVGAVAGSSVGASFAGATIGAIGGGIIGAVTTPTNCVSHDQYGNTIKVRCP